MSANSTTEVISELSQNDTTETSEAEVEILPLDKLQISTPQPLPITSGNPDHKLGKSTMTGSHIVHNLSNRVISVAPMMKYTNRHFRHMIRLLSRKTVLFTEMVVDTTVTHTYRLDKSLGYHPIEHPLVLQLGGHQSESLCKAAKVGEQYGYDAINLNSGCPSDKVSGNCFGAALMKEPEHVKTLLEDMRNAVSIPVDIKCRLGVDDMDSYEEMQTYVRQVEASGVTEIIVHARKCILKGLSTKENRSIPPLKYDWVMQLAREFPNIRFGLNGGVQSIDEAVSHLADENGGHPLHSVMIGRAAYKNPCMFADVDRRLYGLPNPCNTRRQLVEEYVKYAETVNVVQHRRGRGHEHQGEPPQADGDFVPNSTPASSTMALLCGPMQSIFHGKKGAWKFKQNMNEAVQSRVTDVREVFKRALEGVPDDVLDEPLWKH